MANLNISDYLSNISGKPVQNNPMSALFSSQSNSSTSSDVSLLSDYASIKNGSYSKLMKKFYREETGKANDDELEEFQKKLDITSDKSAEVAKALDSMADITYSEDNREDISSSVQKFVDKYNAMIDNAQASDSKSVNQEGKWLSNMVKDYSASLSSIGIEVSNDGKMTADTQKLKTADMSTLQNIFGNGVNNFASKVVYKAEQIYSLAKTYGTSASAYTNSGKYNRDYSVKSAFETTT